MNVPANNADRIADLEEQRDIGNDYGVYEARQLALLTGRPVPYPGSGSHDVPDSADNGDGIGTHQYDEHGRPVFRWATCGTCGLSWNDALITDLTPAPSARCPFEYEHNDD